MAATLEALESRITAVEREVCDLRQQIEANPNGESPAELGAQLLRESKVGREAGIAAWDKFMKDMGIDLEPVGAERLQQMMIDEGIDPEGNEFSRELIAMREE